MLIKGHMNQESDNYKIPSFYLRNLKAMQCQWITSRKRFLIFVLITSIVTFLIIYSAKPSVTYFNLMLYSHESYKEISFEMDDDDKITRYTIDTVGCKIPYLNPMDWSVLPYITRDLPQLPCGIHVKPLSSIIHQHLVMNFSSIKDFSQLPIEQFPANCCYEGITRNISFPPDTDDFITYSDCINITEARVYILYEFIRVTCYQNNTQMYSNFHTIAHIKPKTEARCKKYNLHQKSRSKWSFKYNKKWQPINVLFFGIDSVSRLNAYRHLNDVIGVLHSSSDTFDMAGYNKIGDNTLPNIMAMLTGRTVDEEEHACLRDHGHPDRCNFIWNNYSSIGYRTIYGEDAPWIATFNYLRQGFYHQPTDYYLRPLLLAAAVEFFWYKQDNVNLCMGNSTQTSYSINWLKQILTMLDDKQLTRPSFSVLWLASLSHDYLNYVKYAEKPVARFFREGFRSGLFRNTVIFFVSDHGHRWGDIRKTYIGHMEERLPTLFISLPKWFKKRYPQSYDALGRNAKRLVNPLDIYATLVHLMDANAIEDKMTSTHIRSLSLFRDIPPTRTCADIGIPEHYCTCHSSTQLSISDTKTIKAANRVLKTINQIADPFSYLCANVSIKQIISSYVNSAHYANTSVHHKRSNGVLGETVTVTIATTPGNGLFEGTVSFRNVTKKVTLATQSSRINSKVFKIKSQMVGPISRINLYKNDSYCIDDPDVKKYCFCIG